MGLQPELIITRFPREVVVGGSTALPFYRLVKLNNDGSVTLASTGERPYGLTIPTVENDMIDSDGNMKIRDGFYPEEIPDGIIAGIAYIELGETVSPGEYCVPGTNGVGMAGESELTALDAGDLAGSFGFYIDGGASGDKVRVATFK